MADGLQLGDAANPVALGLGLLQSGIGIVNEIDNKAKQKKYLGQLKAYKTPQEVFDIYNAAQNNASQGLDAATLNYLTNQTDQAFSSTIGTANRLGADPNDLSEIFNQKVNAIMKIGAENHSLNMANFDKLQAARGLIADNKAAEFKSQQDIIKNKLQAAGVNLQTATGNIGNGLSTVLASLAGNQIGDYFGTTPVATTGTGIKTDSLAGNINSTGAINPKIPSLVINK
jgi:hypothetical protein